MMISKRLLAPVLSLALFISALPLCAAADTPTQDFAQDRILVVLQAGISYVNRDWTVADFEAIGAKTVTDLTYVEGMDGDMYYELLSSSGRTFRQILEIELSQTGDDAVLQALEALSEDIRVQAASPNLYYTPCAAPNDPYYNGELASMQETLSRVHTQTAWAMTQGAADVTVGIIDSGIAPHEDLTENLVEGYDFYNDTADTADDPSGHGTHIAGIIGAVSGNGIGIAGLCPTASLMPLQVVRHPDSPYYDSGAIIRAVTHAGVQQVDILNCSFTSPVFDEALYHAMSMYEGLVVCAAGNSGTDIDDKPCYPAAFDLPNIISVTSVDADDALASGACYGLTSVDLAAPGTDIWSTVPDGYAPHSGTSMSAAFVSGAAALLLSYNPHLTSSELKQALLSTVDTTDELIAKTTSGGRLHIANAMEVVLRGEYLNNATTVVSVTSDVPLSVVQLRVTYDPERMKAHSFPLHEWITAHTLCDYSLKGQVVINIYPAHPTVFSFSPARCNFITRYALPLQEDSFSVEVPDARDEHGNTVSAQAHLQSALLGDTNNNGRVTLSDALRTFYTVSDAVIPDEQERLAMDVTLDGTVSIADAAAVFYYVSESKTTFLTP